MIALFFIKIKINKMINYVFCLYFHHCDTEDNACPKRQRNRIVLDRFSDILEQLLVQCCGLPLNFNRTRPGFNPKSLLFGFAALSLQSSSIFWDEFEKPGHFYARNSIEMKKIWFVTDFSKQYHSFFKLETAFIIENSVLKFES